MVDNNYSIPPNFPVGVLVQQLDGELRTIWPVALFPLAMTTTPGSVGVATSGLLVIETQLVLSGGEQSAALGLFQAHVPIVGGQGGVVRAALVAGTFNGETIFVLDEERQGLGDGLLCYWDGRDRNWRRVRDDFSVAVIP